MFAKQQRPWVPHKPASKGAIGYHNAVVNAPYYLSSLQGLMPFLQRRVKDNDLVVDFGSGTGVSALFLLRNLKVPFTLWLVDNSASWLANSYELFKSNPNVRYFLLGKADDEYSTLAETIGIETTDHVVSANTVHLIPNLKETFLDIYSALKPNGTFTFQSGNIKRSGRKGGILMVDDTIQRVRDIALEILHTNREFVDYRKNIDRRIQDESDQRKLIFPDPRPIEQYLKALGGAGFKELSMLCKPIRIKYADWLKFLRVRPLQAGILPEIGGRNPSIREENDRDALITLAAFQLFKELEERNPIADDECFTAEWVYVEAVKDR